MERETRVFTYSHAEGLSKEEYGTFRDTFNRIAALNRQVLEKEKARENGGAEQSEQNAAVAEEAPQAESENVSDGIAAEPRYSADNPYAQWAADDDEVRRNADDWEQRKPLTETVLAKLNREAERQGFTVHIESRHASLGRFSAAREIQDGAYRVEIDGRFKNDGSMSSYEAPRDFTVSFHENGEITDYIYSNDLGHLLERSAEWFDGKIRQTAETGISDGLAAEPHYSEKIIDRLAEDHEWHKEDALTASKTWEKAQQGGMLNPEGHLKVYARFDESGRYLSLESGFDTLMDIDARGIQPTAAAALMNDLARTRLYTDKPFDRSKIEMRLYGMNLYYAAQQSPEAAAEAREILPAPYMCTPERFAEYARVVPTDTSPNWEAYWPAVSGLGMNHALSWAATAAEAVQDIHRNIIEHHLYLITAGGKQPPDPEKIPPKEVMAYYPDLAKEYLSPAPAPAQQSSAPSLPDKFQAAQDAYLKQKSALPSAQKGRLNYMEAQMEQLIKGLPEQTQMQARTNFYASQTAAQAQQQTPQGGRHAAEQSEIDFGR